MRIQRVLLPILLTWSLAIEAQEIDTFQITRVFDLSVTAPIDLARSSDTVIAKDSADTGILFLQAETRHSELVIRYRLDNNLDAEPPCCLQIREPLSYLVSPLLILDGDTLDVPRYHILGHYPRVYKDTLVHVDTLQRDLSMTITHLLDDYPELNGNLDIVLHATATYRVVPVKQKIIRLRDTIKELKFESSHRAPAQKGDTALHKFDFQEGLPYYAGMTAGVGLIINGIFNENSATSLYKRYRRLVDREVAEATLQDAKDRRTTAKIMVIGGTALTLFSLAEGFDRWRTLRCKQCARETYFNTRLKVVDPPGMGMHGASGGPGIALSVTLKF